MLQIRNLRKSFGNLQVLKSIDLDVNKGDVVAILGPSGSGKTTMLRCLNFLEKSRTFPKSSGSAASLFFRCRWGLKWRRRRPCSRPDRCS